ncbi:PPR domain-containing protein/PPR_2 domain-containing protein [Cephalotus follicularis]|uniref:PPR domain-containing protein/PPR_2 domain-containing protein n=1 Tax=Cephalotus follicularis TaxID=3775 RepID=A0A1Q3CGL3_CEPFO|nr:PPR domain-containing protein/PPR_2 domain-containing protein [Cephalotus follicularis]
MFLLHSSPNQTHLRHLHARLLRTALNTNLKLCSKLISMYSQHSSLTSHALSVFLHMPNRNIFSWNIIIGEFSRSCFPHQSILLFVRMWRASDVRPDDFTLPLVLRACAASGSFKCGICLHGLCVKFGVDVSLFVASAFVHMYVAFGQIFNARVVFDGMPDRDAVLWTAMLAGYAQHGEPMLGLETFREMVCAGVELDGVVMVSLLLVCAQSGWLEHGKSVHGWCVRRCLAMGLNIGNATVDMYVKCASLSYAHRVFGKMPERDVITWSSLILGYGLNGKVNVALELFDQMCMTGVDPNGVTILGVLSACAHGGLVERSRWCFEMMKEYGVAGQLKHYASMVDCLARAGHLEEAARVIEEMPTEPDEAVLAAILGGCRVHDNVEVVERIAKKLIRFQPEKSGSYVLLSNIYAAAGKFDEAERVRGLMKQRNVSKIPGYSIA